MQISKITSLTKSIKMGVEDISIEFFPYIFLLFSYTVYLEKIRLIFRFMYVVVFTIHGRSLYNHSYVQKTKDRM
jgi:hypothetical protein